MTQYNHNILQLQRSGIRRFTNMAGEVPGCVMLTIGEPDFPTPENIKAAACNALAKDMTHYAPNQGTLALRRAIADYETARGLPTAAEQVLVTAGATEAIATVLLGVLNPGDEVIIPTPAFSLYESLTLAAGGTPVAMDISSGGFQITGEMLEAAMTEKTRVIVLNSPNNPTGTVLNQESLNAVKAAVRQRDIYILWDGVYNQLAYEACPDLSLDPEPGEKLLLCQSFSKPYAMTGWRVGYLRAEKEIIDRLLLFHAALLAAVPTFLQEACVEALKTDTAPMRQVYRQRRDYCCRRLTEMGLSFPRPAGAFYIFVDISAFGMSSEELCTRLIREFGVAAVPGSCFGAEGFIRISYCCGGEALERGLDRLENFVKMHKAGG